MDVVGEGFVRAIPPVRVLEPTRILGFPKTHLQYAPFCMSDSIAQKESNMSYDSIVITLILLVDSYMTFLMWKAQTRRERDRIKRTVSDLFKYIKSRRNISFSI